MAAQVTRRQGDVTVGGARFPTLNRQTGARSRVGTGLRHSVAVLFLALLHSPGTLAQDPPAVSAPESTFELTVRDDRISVRAEHAPLGEVLQALAREAGLKVHIPVTLVDHEVSLNAEHASLAKVLDSLLEGTSYVLVSGLPPESKGAQYEAIGEVPYRSGPGPEHPAVGTLENGARVVVDGTSNGWLAFTVEDSGSRVFVQTPQLRPIDATSPPQELTDAHPAATLLEVHVLATGSSFAAAGAPGYVTIEAPPTVTGPADFSPTGSDPDVQEALQGLLDTANVGDAQARMDAITAATSIGPGDVRVRELLRQSLQDPEEGIRRAALLSYTIAPSDLPLTEIRDVALRDESPALRQRAIGLLAENFPASEVQSILRDATRDPSPLVREEASKHLRRMEK